MHGQSYAYYNIILGSTQWVLETLGEGKVQSIYAHHIHDQ